MAAPTRGRGPRLVALLALVPLAAPFQLVRPFAARTAVPAACSTLRMQIDSAPEGPSLSGWRNNPAVKNVQDGRTVSLPGYYKDEEKMLPVWAQDFQPGKLEEPHGTITLSEGTPALAVRITNEELSWEPYYCRLVGADGRKTAAAMACKVIPEQGELAPRGKEGERVRTAATDPTGNYKDRAEVRLELTREGLGYWHSALDLLHALVLAGGLGAFSSRVRAGACCTTPRVHAITRLECMR